MTESLSLSHKCFSTLLRTTLLLDNKYAQKASKTRWLVMQCLTQCYKNNAVDCQLANKYEMKL